MLNIVAAAKLPPSISFQRNGLNATAHRADIGSVEPSDGQIRIADSAWVDTVPPLPVHVPSGLFPIHLYQWQHCGQIINACLVIPFARPFFPRAIQLSIETDIRPDLTEGVIVDSGEVAVQGLSSVVIQSGLGDGYYPVFAVKNLFGKIQSIVVDFKLWHVPRYILMPGQFQDEYGFVQMSGADGPKTG